MDVGVKRSREEPATEPKAAVLVYGSFDLFHYEHMRLLEKCKALHPEAELLVGVASDRSLQPAAVMTEAERVAVVQACKWPDAVLVLSPEQLTDEFFQARQITHLVSTVAAVQPAASEFVDPGCLDLPGRILALQHSASPPTTAKLALKQGSLAGRLTRGALRWLERFSNSFDYNATQISRLRP